MFFPSEPTHCKVIPKCLVLNARLIAKPGAVHSLQAELSSNFIDLCFISETWLHDSFGTSLAVGYTFLTKNRNDRNGGGVGIICRNDWKVKKLVFPHNTFE